MIQIKAKQQNVSFEKNVEKLAFVLSAHLYNTLDTNKVIEEAAKRSGMSEGVIKAAWDAAGEVIRFYLHGLLPPQRNKSTQSTMTERVTLGIQSSLSLAASEPLYG